MSKKICRKCGYPYDVNEWAECPHCAREDYIKLKLRRTNTFNPMEIRQ